MLAGLHQMHPVTEASQVGAVRRAVAACTTGLGFDETASGRAAIVATELATNLLRHARGGRVLLATVDTGGDRVLQLIALDHGPGIDDLQSAMRDGASSRATPGTGLGAAARLSDTFDLYSSPSGTIVVTEIRGKRLPPPSPSCFAFGGVRRAPTGEVACGDHFAVSVHDDVATALLVDGLGHGRAASAAAVTAVEWFSGHASQPLEEIVTGIHTVLIGSRGASVSLARMAGNAVTVCGVGNIVTRIVSGTVDRMLPVQNGTAGVAIRTPRCMAVELPPHASLVMHSDGVSARWNLDEPGVLRHSPSTLAAWVMRSHARERDDLSVLVLRRSDQ